LSHDCFYERIIIEATENNYKIKSEWLRWFPFALCAAEVMSSAGQDFIFSITVQVGYLRNIATQHPVASH